MGLSASQGRLLALTSRLSDLELRSQIISNEKMRMADKSQAVSQAYLNALSSEKLTIYNPQTNMYKDSSLVELYNLNNVNGQGIQRVVVDRFGRVVIPDGCSLPNGYVVQNGYAPTKTVTNSDITQAKSNADADKAALESAFGDETTYLKAMLGVNNLTTFDLDTSLADYSSQLKLYQERKEYFKNCYSGLESYAQSLGYTTATNNILRYNDNMPPYYANPEDAAARKLFSNSQNDVDKISNAYNSGNNITPDDINGTAFTTANVNSVEWFYKQLSLGNLFIQECDNDPESLTYKQWQIISWSTGDAYMAVQSNDKEIAKAEATYERDMAEVELKDKKFDLELKTIDTEHDAVQTQIDTVKKVMDKNIDSSFKTFS